ncbi:inositol monophosphatase family protein [Intestinicryptomonas porci]|uniref:Histidinol-phosphatase n=1 Tax=Intestinicryptomonas porci TaxID=2926320 RepID=A0ABU4WJ31_9BACT|nr:histidinol-phosphatase [Opitutales bacterium CLA-KB-P66]
MTKPDFKNFMNELADLSGDYIRGEFGKAHKIESKADATPVTEVDKNTEEILREKIMRAFPEHGIVGEEWGVVNPDAEYQWVLDPIDGTKSFISGIPLFGTLIALMKNGSYELGLIDQPILRERCLGDNSVCLFNGKPVHARQNFKSINGATALISDAREVRFAGRNMDAWRNFEDKLSILRTWGDCYGYMMLCRGNADIMLDPVLEIWDLAALIPCVRGAGAVVSDWFGGSDFGKKGGLVAAANAELLGDALATLNG